MCVRVLVVFLPRCWQRPGDQYLERGSHPVIYTRCTPGEPPLLGRLPSLIRTARERSFPFIDFPLLAYLINLLFIHLMSLLFKLTDHCPNTAHHGG